MTHLTALSPAIVITLAAIGFVGGVGITAIGLGGILPTIGLFSLTPLGPGQVAGTAIVTHVATGALGTAAYRRSGHLAGRGSRRAVVTMASTALVGTPLGILVNAALSPHGFGIVLAVLVAGVALALIAQREMPVADERELPVALVAAIGLVVAVVAGIVGIGGPMLTVPLLVVCGAPMLDSIAASQAQSVVIAGTGSIGYLVHGSIDWSIAALVGIPELAGVLIGWRLARALPTQVLKRVMVVVLLALVPYLAVHG
ncbi:MAG: sulfite exporter TauE/SafE family protein [Nocardioidaceae bacterium]|nr:sulfite exporter TauE/SafE family protein [Nocardioidaceae bacterium]